MTMINKIGEGCNMVDPNKHGIFNNSKKITNLKKVSKGGAAFLLLFVMVMSGINLTTTTGWMNTMWTCIWCLSIVLMTDRLD